MLKSSGRMRFDSGVHVKCHPMLPLVAVWDSRKLQLLECRSGFAPLWEIESDRIEGVAFDESEDLVFIQSNERVQFLDALTGKMKLSGKELGINEPSPKVLDLRDGLLAVSGGDQLTIYDIKNRRFLGSLPGHFIRGAFSQHGRLFVSNLHYSGDLFVVLDTFSKEIRVSSEIVSVAQQIDSFCFSEREDQLVCCCTLAARDEPTSFSTFLTAFSLPRFDELYRTRVTTTKYSEVPETLGELDESYIAISTCRGSTVLVDGSPAIQVFDTYTGQLSQTEIVEDCRLVSVDSTPKQGIVVTASQAGDVHSWELPPEGHAPPPIASVSFDEHPWKSIERFKGMREPIKYAFE